MLNKIDSGRPPESPQGAVGVQRHRSVSRVLSNGLPRPDGHFSRDAVAHVLQQSTRGLCRASGRAAPRRLFDLAPTGVYRAAPVAGSAVGSYPTGSPLPDPLRAIGGVFSVALSVAREDISLAPRRYLAVCPVEPGLSSAHPRVRRDRPTSGLLQYNDKGGRDVPLTRCETVRCKCQPIFCPRRSRRS
jgi:hypothetical protein